MPSIQFTSRVGSQVLSDENVPMRIAGGWTSLQRPQGLTFYAAQGFRLHPSNNTQYIGVRVGVSPFGPNGAANIIDNAVIPVMFVDLTEVPTSLGAVPGWDGFFGGLQQILPTDSRGSLANRNMLVIEMDRTTSYAGIYQQQFRNTALDFNDIVTVRDNTTGAGRFYAVNATYPDTSAFPDTVGMQIRNASNEAVFDTRQQYIRFIAIDIFPFPATGSTRFPANVALTRPLPAAVTRVLDAGGRVGCVYTPYAIDNRTNLTPIGPLG